MSNDLIPIFKYFFILLPGLDIALSRKILYRAFVVQGVPQGMPQGNASGDAWQNFSNIIIFLKSFLKCLTSQYKYDIIYS